MNKYASRRKRREDLPELFFRDFHCSLLQCYRVCHSVQFSLQSHHTVDICTLKAQWKSVTIEYETV